MHTKMIKPCFLAFLAGLSSLANLQGQVIMLNSNLPVPLSASAGDDVTLVSGNAAMIGGNPTASDGSGGYIYLWSPATGLDDPTAANPLASPDISTLYILTVTDASNCWVQDEVLVTVEANGIDLKPDQIQLSLHPNPSVGNCTIEVQGGYGDVDIKVYHATGIMVAGIKREAGSLFREELDTRQWPRGNYYVSVLRNGQVLHKPLVVLN